MKSTRTSGLVLAAAVGLAGVGIGAAMGPVGASAATATTQAVTDRVTAIKNALAGLVKDGTLTQAQADKVATTVDGALPRGGSGGFGRHGGLGRHGGRGDLDTAASVLGMTRDELRTALESGKTLAQVAQGKNISQATLIDKLVAAEKTRIAAEVKAGRLTQAQVDSLTADLTARVTERVTSTRPMMAGRGHHRQDGYGGGTPPTPPAPGSTPSSSGSGTT
jgi:hypothetical protein